MQTFLPYPNYEESARVLDDRRLNKQGVEVLQILNVLHETSNGEGWKNHPAVRMWRGYEVQLCEYGIVCREEWIRRGHNDTVKAQIEQHLDWASSSDDFNMGKPPWFGDANFHLAHQSNLLRKDPEHYGQFFGDIPDDLPYIWPVP